MVYQDQGHMNLHHKLNHLLFRNLYISIILVWVEKDKIKNF